MSIGRCGGKVSWRTGKSASRLSRRSRQPMSQSRLAQSARNQIQLDVPATPPNKSISNKSAFNPNLARSPISCLTSQSKTPSKIALTPPQSTKAVQAASAPATSLCPSTALSTARVGVTLTRFSKDQIC